MKLGLSNVNIIRVETSTGYDEKRFGFYTVTHCFSVITLQLSLPSDFMSNGLAVA